MAIDHFKTHPEAPGIVSWSFHILFDDQLQIAEMAKRYEKAIDYPGLYPQMPTQWIHMTVLGIGNVREYSEEEMNQIVELLKPRLSSLRMPEFLLGSWMIWSGNPVLIAIPWDPLVEVFETVMKSAVEVIGKEREPFKKYFVPGLRFIPHVALSYNRDYDDEKSLARQLFEHPIEPVPFRANKLSLIKQRRTIPHYSWDVAREIPIGQDS